MGVLSWLTGGSSTKNQQGASVLGESTVPESSLFSGFLDLPSLKFFGPYCQSPNKRYTLGWRDANDRGTRGGARSSGLGRYILLEGRDLIAEGNMARPNDGKVADNGVFVLNDWGFSSDLSGVFSAYRPDGKNILSRRFRANLYNNGLAPGGSLAVCQKRATCLWSNASSKQRRLAFRRRLQRS